MGRRSVNAFALVTRRPLQRMLGGASFGHFRLLILQLQFAAGNEALAHFRSNRHLISWLLVRGSDALLHV